MQNYAVAADLLEIRITVNPVFDFPAEFVPAVVPQIEKPFAVKQEVS